MESERPPYESNWSFQQPDQEVSLSTTEAVPRSVSGYQDYQVPESRSVVLDPRQLAIRSGLDHQETIVQRSAEDPRYQDQRREREQFDGSDTEIPISRASRASEPRPEQQQRRRDESDEYSDTEVPVIRVSNNVEDEQYGVPQNKQYNIPDYEPNYTKQELRREFKKAQTELLAARPDTLQGIRTVPKPQVYQSNQKSAQQDKSYQSKQDKTRYQQKPNQHLMPEVRVQGPDPGEKTMPERPEGINHIYSYFLIFLLSSLDYMLYSFTAEFYQTLYRLFQCNVAILLALYQPAYGSTMVFATCMLTKFGNTFLCHL